MNMIRFLAKWLLNLWRNPRDEYYEYFRDYRIYHDDMPLTYREWKSKKFWNG